MRAVIARDRLAAALNAVLPAVPVSPEYPVLTGLRLETTAGRLALQASTGQAWACCGLLADTDPGGPLLVPGKLFGDLIRGCTADSVVMAQDAAGLAVQCGAMAFTVRTASAAAFPQLPAEPPVMGSLPGELFSAALRKVTGACAVNPSRPALTGVLVHAEGDVLSLVTTDGYQLACAELVWDGKEGTMLLPAKAAAWFARVAAGDVTLSWDDWLCTLACADVEVTVARTAGIFPPWKRKVRSVPGHGALVIAADLAAAARQVMLTADPGIPVTLELSENQVRVSAGGERGSAVSTVRAVWTGEPRRVSVGYHLLKTGLAGCPGTARLSLGGAGEPLCLSDDGFRFLAQPRRDPESDVHSADPR